MSAILCAAPVAFGQQPEWRPSRVPANHAAQPLAAATNANLAGTSSANETEQLGSGVVLRWKSTAPRSSHAPTAVVTASGSQAIDSLGASQVQWAGGRGAVPASVPHASSTQQLRRVANGSANPLRSEVAATSYQDELDLPHNPFGDDLSQPPVAPGRVPFGEQLPPLDPTEIPAAPRAGLQEMPGRPDLPELADPLLSPERAPDPGSILDRANPFPSRGAQDASPRDNGSSPELLSPPQADDGTDADNGREELEAPKRLKAGSNLISCDEQRQRVKSRPLQAIDLDVSPSYGEGLRSVKKDTEQERLDFAAGSDIRDWSDYAGANIATGRLIDPRDDRAILDVGGTERAVQLRTLSDVDIAYIGRSWNIPTVCGTGNERFEGRNFVPATVQWTASGLCHKPLYFEQVQLERYGHETGPVLQPLISTAHFFGNIAILPYKMGIHPPHECQYSLGYIRPGNCAPYMVQPIPWSLRGAVAQASFVTGAAALIP